MAKSKSVFFCRNCGFESAKWLGKCPACNEWNTFAEEIISTKTSLAALHQATKSEPMLLDQIESTEIERIDSGLNELNRVLGGGMVPGSMVLLGGEPGIGKSTLALQVALSVSNLKTLYVSGEESLQQIKLRALRLGAASNSCYFLSETSLETVLQQAQAVNPSFIVIDSIQTLQSDAIESSAGTITQIRECTARLLRYAKTSNTPIIIIGHITKDGTLAGPKVLEHIVDVVLQFEGDQHFLYRVLRAHKNRFGATSELGIFEMSATGLSEVTNPSQILISHAHQQLSGIAISAAIDGQRPFMIETQALVSSAAYGTPQRSTTGFDIRRLNMLLAVLEKRAGFRLGAKDVFLNIAGGFRIDDPGIDLAVVSAVLSSNLDVPLPDSLCFAAEVGLSGEIRPVSRCEQRVSEARKLGFGTVVIASGVALNNDIEKTIKVIRVDRIEQLVRFLFGSVS